MVTVLTAVVCPMFGSKGTAFAQVPPDVAAAIRKIGPLDVRNTTELYLPMFKDMTARLAGLTVKRDIAYGPDALNRLDVFSSGTTGPKRPVVLYVHGGAFRAGDKVQKGTPFNDNIMLFAVNNGYVAVNMDYRLSPQSHWPAAHEDMAAVVRWIQANIADYGGDPKKIVAWGVSAGATLIAGYLAHRQFWGPGGPGIAAAVLNSGFYNNLDQRDPQDRGYFGQDPQELRDRSSVVGLQNIDIPLFVSHTTVDVPDAITQAKELRSALCKLRKCPSYAVFKDHSHVSQEYSVGTDDQSVSGPILAFIRKSEQ